MKKLLPASTALSVLLSLLANNDAKAQSQYFTTVANGGTYSWDDPNWNPANSGANTGPYTSTWTAGQFARFYNGAGDNYTVTVNAAESMAGLFLNAGSAATININDAGANTGSLNVVAGAAVTQNGFNWLPQGFLTGGGTVNINAPITGSGGVEEEAGGGNLNLYGVNTFTGGFLAASSATFIGFNNNASFGAVTSQIGFDGTTFAIMNNTGPSTVNIANPVQTIGTTGVNFIGNSATMSGNWFLGGGTSAINIRNNGVAGTVVTLSGVLSGTSGNVTYSGANGGKITLSGVNTYTGKTVVGVSGDTAITLTLGVSHAIDTSTGVTMAGGTLDLGGFTHSISGVLTLSATGSKMDFEGNGTISFANSSAATWGAGETLNLLNYQSDELHVGTDATGLTAGQIAELQDNGVSGELAIDPNGFIVVVPEPSAALLGLLGGAGVVAFKMFRRRKA